MHSVTSPQVILSSTVLRIELKRLEREESGLELRPKQRRLREVDEKCQPHLSEKNIMFCFPIYVHRTPHR